MRTLALLALASAAYSQVGQQLVPTRSSVFLTSDPNRINILPTLHAEPATSQLMARFVPSLRSQSSSNGTAFYTRLFVDPGRHIYLGYELLVERRLSGTCLTTIGKLGVTPMDLAASLSAKIPVDLEWTNLPLPEIPEPRLLHDGESISVDLFVDPATGGKLIDDIRVNPPPPTRFMVPPLAPRPVPTVSGAARDFSSADAELQILQPRVVILNGSPLGTLILRSVRGPLVWIYLPKHGRYILSLTRRPGLDFTKAGEVRGGAISFTIGDDSIKLECNAPFAVGDAAYNLWILHDQDWEPISQPQKERPGIGSVGAAELAALKQK